MKGGKKGNKGKGWGQEHMYITRQKKKIDRREKHSLEVTKRKREKG